MISFVWVNFLLGCVTNALMQLNFIMIKVFFFLAKFGGTSLVKLIFTFLISAVVFFFFWCFKVDLSAFAWSILRYIKTVHKSYIPWFVTEFCSQKLENARKGFLVQFQLGSPVCTITRLFAYNAIFHLARTCLVLYSENIFIFIWWTSYLLDIIEQL